MLTGKDVKHSLEHSKVATVLFTLQIPWYLFFVFGQCPYGISQHLLLPLNFLVEFMKLF